MNPVDFPLPLFNVVMQDFPVEFAAVTTLKWGEGKRKAKMSENEKSSEIDSVSTIFARDCLKDKV